MHDAAAPVGAVSLQLESADALLAPGGFVASPPPVQYPELGPWSAVQGLTVSREALGLEPSAPQLLAEHHDRLRDAMNRQEYVRCAEAYGDAWSPAVAYVHGFAWYPPLNPARVDPEPDAGTA